jgi:DNA-binding transcriptional ArsR family regulator
MRQLPPLGNTSAKLVLMVLADDADSDGTCSDDMSLTVLVQRCGMSRGTVSNALTILRNAGLLKTASQQREDGGTGNSTYLLTLAPSTGIEPAPQYGDRTGAGTGIEPGPVRGLNPPSTGIEPATTRENADPSTIPVLATSSSLPSEVVGARAGATRAHTRDAHAHTRVAREAPPEPTAAPSPEPPATPRRQKLEELNATATHPDTRRLVEAWRAGHATRLSDKLIREMTEQVDRAVRAGYDRDCLSAALGEWNRRDNAYTAKALQWLYDDAAGRLNAGEDPEKPLIDEYGTPRVDPQHIPDEYLTRRRVQGILGPDSQQPPPWPGDDVDRPNGWTEEDATARRAFFDDWAAERLSVRRAEVRRVLVRAWNRRAGVA